MSLPERWLDVSPVDAKKPKPGRSREQYVNTTKKERLGQEIRANLNGIAESLEVTFADSRLSRATRSACCYYSPFLRELARRDRFCRALAEVDLHEPIQAEEAFRLVLPLVDTYRLPLAGGLFLRVEWARLFIVARLGFDILEPRSLPLWLGQAIEIEVIHRTGTQGRHQARVISLTLPPRQSEALIRELTFRACYTDLRSWCNRRGIFKKCVNSQAVYLLSEQHGLEAQERR